ncbi:MAG: TolC family protein, partial [Burkholderiales bacterium]|nr:TolC family protein [Burkholderiales bacterium]
MTLPHPARARPPGMPARTAALAFAAALSAALLAGCASMAPAYKRPPAPVPARFPMAEAGAPTGAAASAEAVADIPWPQFFTDPRLQRLIGIALRDNRDLRLAALALEQAQAQAALRDADRWPTLGAGLTGLRQPNGSGGITSVYTAGLQLSSYEIDLFGRLKSLDDAAAAQVLASAQARRAVQIGLVASVAGGWFALQADDALAQLTRQTLAAREESARLTRLRYEHGAASELDLQAALALRAAARVALAQQQRQRAQDENALALLLGAPVPAEAMPAVDGPASPALPTLPTLPAGL